MRSAGSRVSSAGSKPPFQGGDVTSATLVVSCPDRPGIVSALARLLHSQGANITQSDQYSDSADGMFFQRVCFDLIDPQAGLDSVRDAIATAAWRMRLWSRIVFVFAHVFYMGRRPNEVACLV